MVHEVIKTISKKDVAIFTGLLFTFTAEWTKSFICQTFKKRCFKKREKFTQSIGTLPFVFNATTASRGYFEGEFLKGGMVEAAGKMF